MASLRFGDCSHRGVLKGEKKASRLGFGVELDSKPWLPESAILLKSEISESRRPLYLEVHG